MTRVTADILKTIYEPRPADAKKYDYGLLFVIGGSEFYPGAPALAALAGFRAGVDMVRIVAPRRAADIIASYSPVLAAYPLHGDRLVKEHLPVLLEKTGDAKEVSDGRMAVVIGSGLGRPQETKDLVAEYVSQIDVSAVIDADAIHAVAQDTQLLAGKPFVITPHAYEFKVLTGREVGSLLKEERIKVVQEEAARLQTTILLKGETDIISNGTEVLVNKAGSPYLSGGGTGDTLAGIVGALLARGVNPLEAAAAAAYINGKAGEIAAKKLKESLVATDLIEAISVVIG
ncbi:NAD(P)H-hydrate dehydratase [Patescibacteria group bacterium]|nr:NAD(P)H-hydrate dehydratase [Patescibacteria group bacterium]